MSGLEAVVASLELWTPYRLNVFLTIVKQHCCGEKLFDRMNYSRIQDGLSIRCYAGLFVADSFFFNYADYDHAYS